VKVRRLGPGDEVIAAEVTRRFKDREVSEGSGPGTR